jgi:hypothetical protein
MTSDMIVAQANALARNFYAMMGYVVPEGYRFDRAKHPQERLCWKMACHAFEVIEGTDVEECLTQVED